jgi:hypothetical protein
MNEKEFIKEFRKWLKKRWGTRIKNYEFGCGHCCAWICFDFLTQPDQSDDPITKSIFTGCRKGHEMALDKVEQHLKKTWFRQISKTSWAKLRKEIMRGVTIDKI